MLRVTVYTVELCKVITVIVKLRRVLVVLMCQLSSQETSQCWFSTVSQAAVHPVRGSHGTGRKACVCFSALTRPVTQSVSLAACSLSSVPSDSVLSWHGPATAAALQTTIRWSCIRPACLLQLSLLFYYSYSVLVGLGCKCGSDFNKLVSLHSNFCLWVFEVKFHSFLFLFTYFSFLWSLIFKTVESFDVFMKHRSFIDWLQFLQLQHLCMSSIQLLAAC